MPSSPNLPHHSVKLKAFSKFTDTTKALAAAAAICDGKLDKGLKKFLKTTCVDKAMKVRAPCIALVLVRSCMCVLCGGGGGAVHAFCRVPGGARRAGRGRLMPDSAS